MARNAVFQLHEIAQKRLFFPSEQRHVRTPLATAKRREQPDHQHLVQVVPRRIAAPRLFNTLEYMGKIFHQSNPSILPTKDVLNQTKLNSYLKFQKRFPCRQKQETIWASLDTLFSETCGIVPVALKQVKRGNVPSMVAYYNARPPTFHIVAGQPTYDIRTADMLLLHEATPGHHLQHSTRLSANACGKQSVQRASSGAYTEGWAVYAETLGDALGLESTPGQQIDALEWAIVRSALLSLDVGLTVYGWTDAQALDFWRSTVRLMPENEAFEIERLRKQLGSTSLTYKLGSDAFLRAKAANLEKHRHPDAVKDFHRLALEHGPMPLSLLEQIVTLGKP